MTREQFQKVHETLNHMADRVDRCIGKSNEPAENIVAEVLSLFANLPKDEQALLLDYV